MKNVYCYLLLGSLLLLLTGCPSMADRAITDFSTADLHGMIYDYHGQPCPQVHIRFDDRNGPTSDINGRFVLKNLSKGAHSITLSKDGYEEVNFTFDFLNRTQVLYVKFFSLSQLLELAEQELDNKKLGRADELLSRAEKIDAGNVVLIYLKAILALKRDQVENSLTLLNGILEQGIIEPVVLLTLADIYQYYLKDIPQAIQFLKRYLHQQENTDVLKRLKNLEQGAEKPASAAEPAKPAVPERPVEPAQPPDTVKPSEPVEPADTPEPSVTPAPKQPDKPITTPAPTQPPDVFKPIEPLKPPGNGSTGQ